MTEPIRVLYVDDNPLDRELVREALERDDGGFVLTESATRSEFESHLMAGQYDLILSDFNILGFEGLKVLETVQKVDPELPVVIVTGTGSEEVAVEAMKRGAADYVIKTASHIRRLPATLKSVLEMIRSHQRIRTLEDLTQSALDSLSAHIAILDETGTILATNTSWDKFARENDLLEAFCTAGVNYLDVCDRAAGPYSEEAPKVAMGIREIIAGTSKEFFLEYPCHSPEVKRWFIVRISRMGERQPARVAVSHEDITPRKLAEEALSESEERLRIALESAHIGIFDWNLQTDVIKWNKEHERLFGYEPGTFPGTYAAFEAKIHPNDLEAIRNDIAHARETATHYEREHRVIWPDGSLHWIWGKGCFLYDNEGKPTRMVGVVRDISDRLKIEQEIVQSRDFYLTLFDEFPGLVWRCDPNGKFNYFNRGWLAFTGKDLETELMAGWSSGIHPDDLERCLEAQSKTFEKREPFEIEYRRLRADGEYRWLTSIERPFWEVNGEFGGFVGYCFDITERRAREKDLRRLSTAIEQLDEVIVIMDTGGSIEYVNPAFEKVTGYSKDEALGQDFEFLNSGQNSEAFLEEMWQTILRGEIWQGHLFDKRRDGVVIEVQTRISPIRDQDGNISNFIAVQRDVTKEIDLQKRLRQSEKMEAIGHLAGGIAHDFNNMLQVILAYSQFLQKDLLPGSSGFQDVARILEAGEKAAELTRQLLTFSRRGEVIKAPLDVKPVIKEITKLLERTFPSTISINYSVEGDLPQILGDPTQIHQVLLNLSVNARDAMPHGGAMCIEAKPVTLTEAYAKEHPEAFPGEHLLLSVSDTGEGIPPDVLPRIFEPFFTTKAEGKGTGLGLSTTYGIIRQHGGFIDCSSRPGEGTVFRVYLPVHKGPAKKQDSSVSDFRLPRGTETILMADDQEMIRKLVQRSLSSLGYRIFTAANGREAVQLYVKRHGEIDLLVLDVQMPEMDGLDACEMIRKVDPESKVILSSGFIDQDLEARLHSLGASGYIQKPFTIDNLAIQIRNILDNK